MSASILCIEQVLKFNIEAIFNRLDSLTDARKRDKPFVCYTLEEVTAIVEGFKAGVLSPGPLELREKRAAIKKFEDSCGEFLDGVASGLFAVEDFKGRSKVQGML